MQHLEGVKAVARGVAILLGLRATYRVELLLLAIAVAAHVALYLLGRLGPAELAALAFAYASPGIYRLTSWYMLRRLGVEPVWQPTLPLIFPLVSGAASVATPPLVVSALFNALLLEDVSRVITETEIVKAKRVIHAFIEPLTRSDLALIALGTFIPGLASYLVTLDPLTLAYPIASYVMVAYSLLYFPVEARARVREQSLAEEVARRLPFLRWVYLRVYQRPGVKRLAREAGIIGAEYDDIVRRFSGYFALTVYVSMAAAPLLAVAFGRVAYLVPPLAALALFAAPWLRFMLGRASRVSAIRKNIVTMMIYLASTSAVEVPFSEAMMRLRQEPELARMFAMEREARVYTAIYNIVHDEAVAMERYADTIPDDYYRDTIRTARDLYETVGMSAVFRMLVQRLRDYTTRFIDRVEAFFTNIGQSVISVVFLVETLFPVLGSISNPAMLPWMMAFGGIISTIAVYGIATLVTPRHPSEYINAKRRWRRAAVVFAAVAGGFTILESLLGLTRVVWPPALYALNGVVAFHAALWYASLHDIRLDEEVREKLPDIITLFSNAMARYNDVPRALLELSTYATLSERLRGELRRLAAQFATAHTVSYRGPYWWKFLKFLVGLSSGYGVTPRELYAAISNFMLEYKKLFSAMKTFAFTMMFVVIVGLTVMSLETVTILSMAKVASAATRNVPAGAAGIRGAVIPTLQPTEAEFVETASWLVLLATAIGNGVALSSVAGRARDARFTLIVYTVQILLTWLGAYHGFFLPITEVQPGGA